ncbi:MAG TPA: hypothetical protein VLX11_03450 [Candidatus Acidoferrales bacterium]|nr:hypothetical protein [Candidatus Acidoferrales bacterium]
MFADYLREGDGFKKSGLDFPQIEGKGKFPVDARLTDIRIARRAADAEKTLEGPALSFKRID